MRNFDFFQPKSLEEACSLLDTYGDEAKILSGGQSLLPLMKQRFISPSKIIHIGRISDLNYIVRDKKLGLRIGALSTYRMIGNSHIVKAVAPILSEAALAVGDAQVRNLGTIGGSLCHADPTADIPVAILASDGELRVRSSKGSKSIKATDFFTDTFQTTLGTDELLTEVVIPTPLGRVGEAYLKLSRRSGDFSIVSVAAKVELDSRGRCKAVKLALGGIGPTPQMAKDTVKLLLNKKPQLELINEVADQVSEETDPPSDIHASSNYRKGMVKVFVKRALSTALERAMER